MKRLAIIRKNETQSRKDAEAQRPSPVRKFDDAFLCVSAPLR